VKRRLQLSFCVFIDQNVYPVVQFFYQLVVLITSFHGYFIWLVHSDSLSHLWSLSWRILLLLQLFWLPLVRRLYMAERLRNVTQPGCARGSGCITLRHFSAIQRSVCVSKGFSDRSELPWVISLGIPMLL
jgi:hypothetical protein